MEYRQFKKWKNLISGCTFMVMGIITLLYLDKMDTWFYVLIGCHFIITACLELFSFSNWIIIDELREELLEKYNQK